MLAGFFLLPLILQSFHAILDHRHDHDHAHHLHVPAKKIQLEQENNCKYSAKCLVCEFEFSLSHEILSTQQVQVDALFVIINFDTLILFHDNFLPGKNVPRAPPVSC